MIMSGHHDHDTHRCCEHVVMSSVHQTLDEMEFERGVWSAAKDGDIDGVKTYLLKNGDPNIKDTSGYTALLYASRNGHYNICELLLKYGADCNLQTPSGGTAALHRAAYCGHHHIVDLLIKNGADVMSCDSDGKTALHKAAETGKKICAVSLMKANKDIINVSDNRGKKARDYIDGTDLTMRTLFDETCDN